MIHFILALFLQVQTVSGSTATITAKADDAMLNTQVGIASVQCAVASTVIGTLTQPTTQPDLYAFSWDTTKTPNGQVIITCTATDLLGLHGTATATVNVVNNQAPTVTILLPIALSVVTGKTSVEARATSPTSVKSMSLLISGRQVATVQGPALSYLWNTSPYKRQTVALTVTAVDPAGNIGTKAIQVTVR